MVVQKKIRPHTRKIDGKKVRVRGHLRIKRVDIKKKGRNR